MKGTIKIKILIFFISVVYITSNDVSAGEGKDKEDQSEKQSEQSKFQIAYKPLTSDVAKEVQTHCQRSMPAAEIKVTPSDIVVPNNFKKYAEKIKNLEVRSNDIWIISYPKSGSTWTQEMVWLLTNNVDIETANREYLWERCMFLEYKGLCSADNQEPDPLELIKKVAPGKRRYIKTHMPVELLPTDIMKVKPKIIHVSRNPYDVAVSYFYHYQIWNNYDGSEELFFRAFLKDEVVLSPFWKHVLNYWKFKDTYDNILYITYEEMKENLVKVMKKVAGFLEVKYPEDKETDLIDHLSFKSMRDNPMDNFEGDIKELHPTDYQNYHYMRKGIVGSWKQEEKFTPFIRQFEEWTNRNIRDLQGNGFPQSPLELTPETHSN